MDDTEFYVMNSALKRKTWADTDVRMLRTDRSYFEFCDQGLDRVILPVGDNLPLGDFVRKLGVKYLMSGRAKEIVTHFRCCDSIQWIPVTVERMGRVTDEEYWYLHNVKEHKVIHHELSDIEYVTGLDVIFRIHRLVLRTSAIPPFDMFHGERDWFASSQLKEVIGSARLTRFEFDPVEMAD